MIYLLDIIMTNQSKISGKVYVLNTLYFLPETALVVILSQSIKWSLITNQKYQEMLLKSVREDTDLSLDQQDSIVQTTNNLVYAVCDDETYSSHSNPLRNIQSEIRRMNAFSANDNLEQLFFPVRSEQDRSVIIANRKTTSDINVGNSAAVPQMARAQLNNSSQATTRILPGFSQEPSP